MRSRRTFAQVDGQVMRERHAIGDVYGRRSHEFPSDQRSIKFCTTNAAELLSVTKFTSKGAWSRDRLATSFQSPRRG